VFPGVTASDAFDPPWAVVACSKVGTDTVAATAGGDAVTAGRTTSSPKSQSPTNARRADLSRHDRFPE
jgi:hypothetical protein